MPKPIFLLLVLALLAGRISAECPVGVYIVRDQATLNKFRTIHTQCEELDALSVREASAFDLSPLGDIKKIKGDATFDASFNFRGLSGMTALKEIGGTLLIDDMDSLVDLAGLETLERIGGNLVVMDNSQLLSLTGLFMLKEIGGKLEILNNGVLKTLNEASSLKFLGLTPTSDLIIGRNPLLEEIKGLHGITEIKGRLWIHNNKLLREIDALSGITLIDSSIVINANDSLRNTFGLRNLEVCHGKIEIGSNAGLKEIDLPALKSIRTRFNVGSNPQLRSLKGMNSVLKFDGELYIKANLKLDTIRAFNNLVEAGTLIDIGTNGGFPDFGFLGNLKRVTGSFTATTTHAVSFAGLDSLESVGEDFIMQAGAKTLTGLENLRFVGRRMIIQGDSLQSVAALAKLDTVRELTITYSPRLTSLAGLDNLDADALGFAMINFNPKLAHCSVKSICAYLDRPGKFLVGGNTGNCKDTAAVRKACKDPSRAVAPGIGKPGNRTLVKSDGRGMEIRFSLAKAAPVGFRVYGTKGEVLADRRSEAHPAGEGRIKVSLENPKRGVYLVEVVAGSVRTIHKAVF